MHGQDVPAEPLCVDGKTLRGSENRHHSKRQRYTHTVQLFGQHSALVRASREDKDEVAALLRLLEDVEGTHSFTNRA